MKNTSILAIAFALLAGVTSAGAQDRKRDQELKDDCYPMAAMMAQNMMSGMLVGAAGEIPKGVFEKHLAAKIATETKAEDSITVEILSIDPDDGKGIQPKKTD